MIEKWKKEKNTIKRLMWAKKVFLLARFSRSFSIDMHIDIDMCTDIYTHGGTRIPKHHFEKIKHSTCTYHSKRKNGNSQY